MLGKTCYNMHLETKASCFLLTGLW